VVYIVCYLYRSIFEKALAEPSFSPTYAEFCRRLSDQLPQFEETVVAPSASPAAPAAEGANVDGVAGAGAPTGDVVTKVQTYTFKRLLLQRCQEEFEAKENPAVKARLELLEVSSWLWITWVSWGCTAGVLSSCDFHRSS